ncbi:MAG: helix-turn-helix domain-containing protein [Arcicella sp.]|nr:helix-turn-helix domain-containing protein [Arcicella sp.]
MQPISQSNVRLELADQYVRFTHKNIFLTGKAGTGKTTFLKKIRATSPKRVVVVAPTGVAAINAGGVTIHSFFQLSFGPNIPAQDGIEKPSERRFTAEKIKAIKAIDLLVIDEISMVRADILDAIDEVLRRFRNRNLPFGGVQLLMIGDLHQLSPVIKDDEWAMLRPYYSSVYFFESRALAQSQFLTIELTHIFRQADEVFIGLLNKVRDKKLDAESVKLLNTRYIPNFQYPESEKYITLTSHNHAALTINKAKMQELSGKTYTFIADIEDDFAESMYPNELNLELKVGAQIMFVKNDINSEKRYFNGKLGEISEIEEGLIYVKCPNEKDPIIVSRVTWDNIKYVLDDSKILQENIIGTFTQYPIKAAWAITIHKSQGLTFDRAIIDAASSFAHGQVYVALSRCKTFEGLVLSKPISPESVKSDSTILVFDQESEKQDLSETALNEAKKRTQSDWIMDLFDFKTIQYGLITLLKEILPLQSHFVTGTFENISKIQNDYDTEIKTVIETFRRQLESLIYHTELPEADGNLQDRIKKGSVYIASKLGELIYNPLKNISLECDNKEIQKDVLKIWEQNLKNIFEKLLLLKNNQQGFDSTKYLTTKANATLDFETELLKLSKSQKSNDSSPNGDLYNQLRRWRDEVAEEKNLEKYMVLAQKTMQNLVEVLPQNKTDLAKVSGLGKVKVQQFGDDILDIITTYCQDNQIDTSHISIPEKRIRKSIVKGSTQELSFTMFKEGKTIAEIAQSRNLSLSTIEGHLSEYVQKGDLSIEDLMDEQKVKILRKFLLEHPDMRSGEVREALNNEFSYGEIKMVGASLSEV